MATLQQGVEFGRFLESVASTTGLHVGLTGGCLYKGGIRKDVDFVVYSHDENEHIDVRKAKFLSVLEELDTVGNLRDFERVVKLDLVGIPVDLIFPELSGVYDG